MIERQSKNMVTESETPSVSMASNMTPKTSSLEALHGNEQRKIMDLVDRLRRAGLSSVLKLPQIVVCGDQSSGKSSVLEAITEIPFPRKENLCTRFATEIIMRRDVNESIRCKINPDENRPSEERQKLQGFNMTISNFEELPVLIEKATELMGIGEHSGVVKAFARDVLSVEITGPSRPQLTLVDLPGLIHAENKTQSKQDVELIRSLVQEYITNERTVILAVITAKNDYANQIILERARAIDPEGARTLGIITKPDFLTDGSENQKAWFELAMNKDIFFKLGWHMLRNRKDNELKFSFAERNANEVTFFSTGKYRELPRSMVGVDSLRTRLSKLLFDHLKKELPGLKKELDTMADKTEWDLDLLGAKRSTLYEQKNYLMDIFTEGEKILSNAITGQYSHQFFGEIDVQSEIDSDSNVRRLRALVQDLNLKFSRNMQLYGHRYQIPKSKAQQDADKADDPLAPVTEPTNAESDEGGEENDMAPTYLSRAKAIDWVLKLLRRSRGTELPGVFNPNLISHLFWEQSAKWGTLSNSHINRVADHCVIFFDFLLGAIAAPEVKANLISYIVEPALQKARTAAMMELKSILNDMKRHPITYNHYFTTTLQKIRQEKYTSLVKRVVNENSEGATTSKYCNDKGNWLSSEQEIINPDVLETGLIKAIEKDMDIYSAEEALDVQIAYYKDERKYFINVIAKQIIERHLIAPLPDILAPKILIHMDNEVIEHLAAEPAELAAHRAHLESQMDMLQRGQEAFLRAMGVKM